MNDSYVPDPDRDSRELVASFLDRLQQDLADYGVAAADREEIRREIDAERARLEQDPTAPTPADTPARYNRRFTAAVLAAYRVLEGASTEHGLPAGEALVDWLTDAFAQPWRETVAGFTKAMLDEAPDPYAVMVEYAKERERTAFGAEFEFRHVVDDGERFHTDVHQCGFHALLAREGAPELTRAFCAFDANWIDAIDPERHGLSFTRDTTIGFGGGYCPFHFERRARQD